MSEERSFEMLWDCQFCGTKRLLGKTHRFCANCGAPQNPDSRYFPSDEDKVEVHDHVFVGADKICGSCQELNAGNSEFCQQCGAPLTESARAKTLADQSRREGEQFESMASRDLTKEQFEAEMERVGVRKPKNKNQVNKKVLFAVIGVIAIVVAGLAVAFFWKQEVTVTAIEHSWERAVVVEEYQNFEVGGWIDQPPAGDNVVRGFCSERQRGTRSVPDGQDCRTVRSDRGDGTFTERQECTTRYREEPVYDDWCEYTGQAWTQIDRLVTNGLGITQPYYAQVQLNCEGQRTLGCNQAQYEDHYWVTFRGNEGREYRCEFPESDWINVEIESVWTVEVRVVDQDAADCNTLKLVS